jgi:hypothetical protein
MAPSRRKLKGGTGVIVRILVDLDLNFDGQQAEKWEPRPIASGLPGVRKFSYLSLLYFPVST